METQKIRKLKNGYVIDMELEPTHFAISQQLTPGMEVNEKIHSIMKHRLAEDIAEYLLKHRTLFKYDENKVAISTTIYGTPEFNEAVEMLSEKLAECYEEKCSLNATIHDLESFITKLDKRNSELSEQNRSLKKENSFLNRDIEYFKEKTSSFWNRIKFAFGF